MSCQFLANVIKFYIAASFIFKGAERSFEKIPPTSFLLRASAIITFSRREKIRESFIFQQISREETMDLTNNELTVELSVGRAQFYKKGKRFHLEQICHQHFSQDETDLEIKMDVQGTWGRSDDTEKESTRVFNIIQMHISFPLVPLRPNSQNREKEPTRVVDITQMHISSN